MKKSSEKKDKKQKQQEEQINKEEQKQTQQEQEAKTEEKKAEEEQSADTQDEVQSEKKEEKEEGGKTTEKSDIEKLTELQDKYLRLSAEYDNYRRRTLKEKMELSKNAGEDILQSILPVIDDFDRALQSIDESQDIDAVKEGIHLIHSKLTDVLKQKGVKEIEAKDQEFDTDKHEAVSKIPAPTEEMKGKIVDVVQKGYYLNDKVLRFSKVVVGE